jgi:hypothetical protein
MTRKDLNYIKSLLMRTKPMDEHVIKAISFIDRDIAIFDAHSGQLKEMYSYDADDYPSLF